MNRRALIRWSQGTHKISLERELDILFACLRRVRAAHALVRAMYRGAIAAQRARRELARMPHHKTADPPRRAPDGFLNARQSTRCFAITNRYQSVRNCF